MTYVWLVMNFCIYDYKPSHINAPSVHSTPEGAFKYIQELVQEHNDGSNDDWVLEKDTPPHVDDISEYYISGDTCIWIERVSLQE